MLPYCGERGGKEMEAHVRSSGYGWSGQTQECPPLDHCSLRVLRKETPSFPRKWGVWGGGKLALLPAGGISFLL